MESKLILGIIAIVVIVLAAFLVPAIMQIRRTAKTAEDFLLTTQNSLKPLMIKLDETLDRTNNVVAEVEQSVSNVQYLTKAIGETGTIINEMNSFIRKTQSLVSVTTHSYKTGIKAALGVLTGGLKKKEVEK